MSSSSLSHQKALYPLRFTPILLPKIWGGTRISALKGMPPSTTPIGESWEISPLTTHLSVVSHGALQGYTLQQLVQEYGVSLLGHDSMARYGATFPLLVKIIDANAHLSVQVHPDDAYAQRYGGTGKTEMWYLLDSDQGAQIYAGWQREVTPQSLRSLVQGDTLLEYLRAFDAAAGQIYYLPAGRVHTIGKGSLLLEIQQPSDITYRLYDYNRLDDQGQPRTLHINEAIEVLDYSITSEEPPYTPKVSQTNTLHPIVTCDYFTTSLLELSGDMSMEAIESFRIISVISGEVRIESDLHLRKGDTCLVPASLSALSLQGQASIIECHIPPLT